MNRLSVAGTVVLLTGAAFASSASAQVVAVPDSGTADAGTASKAIASVVANDSINGAAVVLGSSGNATVAKSGTWQTGLVLNQTTGALTTTAALAAGTYSPSYILCDVNSNCATAMATVTVVTPSIIAVAQTATVDVGIGAQPIKNVAQGATINGVPATLGATGNAHVTQSTNPTWPAGFVLNTVTGAISSSMSIGAGTYNLGFNLCDRNTPAVCTTATDTINAIQAVIVASSYTGTVVAGMASKPIPSVIVNDTVNGAAVVLGTTGNATISQTGTWPAAITLSTTTGAVSTTTALIPGTYNLTYQLCDRDGPPGACATGAITISVNAAVVALPIAGSAVVGTTGTPIGFVPMQDLVNNAPVVLGMSPNAVISQAPNSTWPSGFTLDQTAGAINTDSSVQVGTYSLQYQLCDLNSPPNCAVSTATVAITAPFTEVLATSTPIGDVEFDWGRDGVHCPSCNFGDGNDRANWTNRQGYIYIAHLDPNTGLFTLPGANDEIADTSAYFWNTYGNGPEWAFSTQNGQVVSQLVYSRYQPGQPAQPQPGPGYSGAAYTTQTAYNGPGSTNTNWTAAFLPGAIAHSNGTPGATNSNLPEASQCNTDPLASVVYKNFVNPLQLFSEYVGPAPQTPSLVPYPVNVVSNGIGERFVPCTHEFTYQGTVTYPATGQTVQQVFWYNIDTGVTEQVTSDQTNKYAAFMFRAPEFNDNYILFTLSDHLKIIVYQQTGTNADGSPSFQQVNSIVSPDPNETYLNTLEPFINCTPTCQTYVYTTLCKTSTCANGVTEPNGLAVVGLSPANPLFYIMVQASSLPARQRLDPEYYILPSGPVLYYNRIVPQSGSTNYNNQGEYFINTQLGAPSGACVGSSAEGGLAPGC